MLWRRISISLLVFSFFYITLATVGCGKKEVGEKLKLIVAGYVPPMYEDVHYVNMSFIDYVNKHGKDKVELEYFHSGSLLKAKELLPGLMQDTADIIFHTCSYVMSTYPIFGVAEMPFLYKDSTDGSKKFARGKPLYDLINKELSKKNLFMIAYVGPLLQHVWTVKRPVRTSADLKGLRIRCAGRVEAKTIKALGASPTTMATAELYEALQRGTVDGAFCVDTTIRSRALHEVIKYGNVGAFGSYGEPILMRLDKWQNLPQDVRDIMLKAGEVFHENTGYILKYEREKIIPVIEKNGVKLVLPNPAEIDSFRKKVKPVWDWWKKQLPKGVGEKAIKLATE